ncbi:MAG TPA: HD domain-containing phosphohydrolase [Solirubrobacteraceae bacterium]|jgi:diguanylate cyclase (GGDEF)-like protein|nr:HD domain-containing phosphohydrolase [Solirubrobacteraceae bacterium]
MKYVVKNKLSSPTGAAPGAWSSRVLGAVVAVACLATAFDAAHALVGFGGSGLDGFANEWVYTGIELIAIGLCVTRAARRADDRAAWLLISAALLAWTGGDFLWTIWLDGVSNPPYPSVADGMYLAFYPAAYVGLTLLMRSHFRHTGAAIWLDGIVVGLTIAALGADLIFPAVLGGLGGDGASVGVNLAYPLGDFLLLVFIAVGFTLSNWRPGRQWLLLGAGIAINATADMLYVYQVAKGTYVEGNLLDTLWPASMAMVGIAAWQPGSSRPARNAVARHTIVLPAASALVALVLLVSSSAHQLTGLSIALATLALLAAGARAGLTYRENVRMLRRETRDATTDALTQLGNRRRLMDDLELALAGARRGVPSTLAFFDLDGFKRYNDSFGHGAGDELLTRLGKALAGSLAGHGQAYRLGGDEFCALLSGRLARDDAAVATARQALAEQGSGFTVTASCGVVILPEDASTVSAALNLADERMYADKSAAGRSNRARTQTVLMQQSVLMQLLTEREPSLHDHVCDVGALATQIGRRMGLDYEQLDELRRAAELHDLGKLAVPDRILNKPGPLNESEWRLMRQHTIIGERILNAAPALRPVGRLVRSSHERWDGDGYPDGLAGTAIPLGSRIIAACDAYDAIVSVRSYDAARSSAEALAELRRSAGSQFDPDVVELLCAYVEGHTAADRSPGEVDIGRLRG